jgi:transcriptional regulator with XRE-family HTH domain
MTGSELRQLREASGFSMRGLARRIGVDPKTIARWEKGEHPIGLVYEKLIRIQAAAPRVAQP